MNTTSATTGTETRSSESETLLVKKTKINRSFPVELCLFFVFINIGEALIGSTSTNAIEAFYCRYTFDVSHEQCFNSSDVYLEKTQKFASTIQYIYSTVGALTGPFLLLFAGPWSDIHGRKFLILISSSAYVLHSFSWLFLSTLDKFNPWWILVMYLTFCIFGGSCLTIFAALCYICDTTREENRSFSLGLVQGSMFFGIILGNFLSIFLVKYGYVVVFSVASFFVFLAFIDALLIKETVPKSESSKFEIKNIFKVAYLKDLGKFLRKQTEKCDRKLIIILIARFIYILITNGQDGIQYLFLQWKWNISLEQYASMNTISTFIQGASVWAVTLFLRNKVGDIRMLLLVSISELIAVMPFIFSNDLRLIYVAIAINSSTGLFGIFYKSFLSKIVDEDDVGKVLTVTQFGESFSTMVGVSIYNMLYQATLLKLPTAVYMLSSVGCMMIVICFWMVSKMN